MYLFLHITLVHACISVSLHNVRKSTLYTRYLSSIIRYPSIGKNIAIRLKFKSHRSQSKNQEGVIRLTWLNVYVIPNCFS